MALANAVLAPVDILVLDEPTNHLDSEMAQWLEDYLADFRGAIIMVTHDRYFLDSIATRIVEIERGRLYSYSGNYAEYLMLKAERQNMEIATERKRQSLLRTELAWLARGARARSTKQKAHIERIRAMQEKQGPIAQSRVQMSSVSSRMGRTTIELENICKAYGDRKLIEDYTYIFLKNDRIGIVGPNGCGKSTLLKIINGIVPQDSGSITIGQTIRMLKTGNVGRLALKPPYIRTLPNSRRAEGSPPYSKTCLNSHGDLEIEGMALIVFHLEA